MINFKIISNNNSSPYYNNHILLSDYYTLRKSVFAKYGMNYYDNIADLHDLHQDTHFILILDDNKLVGGRRIVIHAPHSNIIMKTEYTIKSSIASQLDHLNVHSMMFAEIGGLCFDESIQGQGLSEKMYNHTFDLIKMLGCNFVVSEVVPHNLTRIIDAAKRNGATAIVPRLDDLSIDGFNDFRLYISFNDTKLLSNEHAMMGIGESLSKEQINELIVSRQKLINLQT